jgi:hypothetical protein
MQPDWLLTSLIPNNHDYLPFCALSRAALFSSAVGSSSGNFFLSDFDEGFAAAALASGCVCTGAGGESPPQPVKATVRPNEEAHATGFHELL